MINDHLEIIRREIEGCQKCSLYQLRKNVVPGSGCGQAQIVFVGEGPGKQEDILGKPFVGRAGMILDKLLATINLQREQIFITNIVKCRPPANRDPLFCEWSVCASFLERQLDIINPILVVLLGRYAVEYFLPNIKLSQAHGQLQHKEHRFYLPLYHPAAAIYNPKIIPQMENDFAKIPPILQKLLLEKNIIDLHEKL